MKKAVVFVFLFSAISAFAQAPAKALKTFDSGGLKFSYPSDWNVADQSTSDIQNILLSKKGTNALISLISPLASPGSQEDYERMQNVINTLYVNAVHEGLATRLDPPRQEGTCLSLNGRDISGNRYIGVYNNEPSSGEIYPFLLGNRFITVIYLRTDKDAVAGEGAWREMIKSLYLARSNKDIAGLDFKHHELEIGIVNGYAKSLIHPSFFTMTRSVGSGLTVIVNVTIDETGKVISATSDAKFGEARLAAIQAAKMSRFTPTIRCGKPIKVTGRIIYDFRKGNRPN